MVHHDPSIVRRGSHLQGVVDARRAPKNRHAWEEIVSQLTQEQDHFRVVELAHRLNEAMRAEEREKVRRRLGVGRSNAA
jgi:hypothetical protein